MKTNINIAFLFLLLVGLISCTEANSPIEEVDAGHGSDKNIQVAFNVAVPLASLPSGRAITDDQQVDDYTVWVFNGGLFKEAVNKGDTYSKEEADGTTRTYPKVSYDSASGKMYLLLSEEYKQVRLVMIANVDVNLPAVNTSLTEVQNQLASTEFNYNVDRMPLYGETDGEFEVKLGAEGRITLLRAMAKVEVDATTAADHFTLEKIYVYNVNEHGTVYSAGIINTQDELLDSPVEGMAESNIASVYIPERAGVNGTNKSFVIVEGKYTGESVSRFYHLDFIKRITTTGGIKYERLENIQRNHRYVFKMDYVTATSGYSSLKEAVETEKADNEIGDAGKLMVIDDLGVMDITTDNYTYLGVTAGKIDAYLNMAGTHYVACIRVVTNNVSGWKTETLPDGVSLTLSSWAPRTGEAAETVQSVWVFIDKSEVSRNDTRILYIYSGNIRKKVEIKIP